ncbi:MAG: imidazole glycerol phosphate synthase subunit HisF [Desulfamplus sp.]|nr:imidazole glycerol phosphate synthase subunit HisF [Desulfamplus sp.]MBF0414094.1 imidazole glycerol phosphate synthase subunit HisF [Desulfamplus sp.]
MLKTRVIPCLLLDNGRLVKTVNFKKPYYIGDPVNAIKIFNEKEVDELILLDITATKENKPPPFDIIETVSEECFMPLTYGGGVKTIDDMRRIFSLGVEKISLNSVVAENPQLVEESSAMFGSQSIVVSMDVKKNFFGKYCVYYHSGTRPLKQDIVEYAQRMEKKGAGEILLNSIHNDGKMAGYDISLIKTIVESISIPVIVLGGAGSMADIVDAVNIGGASAVAAGSFFVYQAKNMGVLINFPSRKEIENRLK